MKQKILLGAFSVLCLAALLAPGQVFAEGKDGSSITCTISNNQVWDINGGYTAADIQPQVALYQGGSYIQRFTTSANNAQVTAQLSAQTSSLTYTLYNSADNSGAVLTQIVCPAKTVAATPAPQPAVSQAPQSAPVAVTSAQDPTDTKVAESNAVAPASTKKIRTETVTLAADETDKPLVAAKNVGLLLVFPVLIILLLVSFWVVFTKAGRPGWASLIPVYNSWVLFEMGGKPGWWSILSLIPIVNFVAIILYAIAAVEIAKRFGKSAAFGIVGLVLFSFIGWPYLAFSKARYTEPAPATAEESSSSAQTTQA